MKTQLLHHIVSLCRCESVASVQQTTRWAYSVVFAFYSNILPSVAMAGAGIDSGFHRALARFKDNLSPDQREEFAVTCIEDVQKTIAQIQSTQGSERKMRNLTRIKAFLEAMEQYGKVIEVFLNVSDILAFVWVRRQHSLIRNNTS